MLGYRVRNRNVVSCNPLPEQSLRESVSSYRMEGEIVLALDDVDFLQSRCCLNVVTQRPKVGVYNVNPKVIEYFRKHTEVVKEVVFVEIAFD